MMGILSDTQKDIANNVYEASRKYLRQKNGYTHVMVLNLTSALANEVFSCDGKVTTQLNQFIVAMQKDGYEILNIKITPTLETGIIAGKRNCYLALITYK